MHLKSHQRIINTKIETVSAQNPTMSRGAAEKVAKTLAFLEIRELDKENK